MRIRSTRPLCARDGLEDGPTLRTIEPLLEGIPDEKLLGSRREARGKGVTTFRSPSPGACWC